MAVAVHCWGEECHVTQILLHTANMPVVPVLTPGTCTCPHLSLVRRVFFFLAQRNVHLLLAHVPGCRDIDADMLLGRRWRGSGPEHAGHCPCRRWFRLTFGSGFNTSPAGELRGCQHVTGLRVRAESVPDCLSGGGDPSPVPLQEFVLDLFVALRGTRLSVATLRTHVAGLQHFSFRFGFPTKVAGRHSLGLCCAASNAPRPTASRGRLGDLSVPPRFFRVRTFAATYRLATLSCSSPRSSPPSLACCAPRDTAPPLCAALPGRSTCSTAISLSIPNAGWEFAHHGVIDRSLPGGGGGVRAPLPRRLRFCPFTALHQLLGTHPTFAGPCSPSGPGHT